MCKSPEGFYLTADENQSIYGRGYSWRQVSSDLRVQGRSILLRNNYRTTMQIQEAAAAFLHQGEAYDEDSMAVPVHEGPLPTLCECEADSTAIAYWFRRWADELRLPVHMGAVLTPTNGQAEEIAENLCSQGVKAQAFRSGDLEVDAPVVKCMTLHASKGLEFPFVAVAGLTADRIPRKSYTPVDEDDWNEHVNQERKLLHVALTRAMWRLLVCSPDRDGSEFISGLAPNYWRTVAQPAARGDSSGA